MGDQRENTGNFLREASSLALRDAVTTALSASGSLVQAAPDILRAVCTTFGWQTGALWTVEPDLDQLQCVSVCPRPYGCRVVLRSWKSAATGAK
jgi:hypothetical protein